MLLLKIKGLINRSLIKKLKKKIIEESYSIYKSTAKNRINTMWLYSKISKFIESDHSLKDIALRELVAEQKITLEHDNKNNDDVIILSEAVITENSHDYLSARAFLKKCRSDIISILALLISIFALLKT